LAKRLRLQTRTLAVPDKHIRELLGVSASEAPVTVDIRWPKLEAGSTSTTGARKARAHLPGLDGLRGLAILSVILFHTPGIAANGSIAGKVVMHIANLGWIGVDLFFVLSGFLITGILIDERESPTYFRTFFSRRILRIVPVYVAFILFSMWVAPVVHAASPESAAKLRDLQPWYWSYLVNIFIALHGWSAIAEGTTHLWSLCVEEQFYLLWPIAVFALSARTLPRLAMSCILAAEAIRVVLLAAGARGEVNYILLPTRIDALAVGALFACAARDDALREMILRWRTRIVAIALLALLPPLLLEHTLDFQQPLTQLLALPAIAALSGLFVLRATESAGWLAARPLRLLGRYSYGMYIWHLAAITLLSQILSVVTLRRDTLSAVLAFAGLYLTILVVTVSVALASWYLIEAPFLRLKRLVPYA
jgi:peptidoglycan/LPS O-acetylase OafA/YrhL